MNLRKLAGAMLMVITGFLPLAPALAQTGTPVIRSLSVEQVAQLSPGTELIFRAAGAGLKCEQCTYQLSIAPCITQGA